MHETDSHALAKLEALAVAINTNFRRAHINNAAFAIGTSLEDPENNIDVADLIHGDAVGALVGAVAPSTWNVFGVVITDPIAGLVFLVARDGSEVIVLSSTSDTFQQVISRNGPGTGRMVDVCRRVFGLPTQTHNGGVNEYFAVLWLDQILTRSLQDPGSGLTWQSVVKFHPVFRYLLTQQSTEPCLENQLIETARAIAKTTTWHQLRQRCIAGTWSIEGISASDSAWMDDHMFARWTLDTFPLIETMLEPLEALLPPATTCQIVDALIAWDLL